MRVAISIAACGAILWLLVAGGDPVPVLPCPGSPAGCTPEWGTAWEVLSPRDCGTSPTPIVAFLTPGWDGPVEVSLEVPGRRFVAVTSARSLAWPLAIGPLRVGSWCGVSIAGPAGLAADASYQRVSAPRAPTDRGTSDTMSRAWGR